MDKFIINDKQDAASIQLADERGQVVAIVFGASLAQARDRAKTLVTALENRSISEDVIKGIFGEEAIEAAVRAERRICAQIAEDFGISRRPQSRLLSVIQRHEGEVAASRAIAGLILRRGR